MSKLETIRAVRFGYGQGPGVAPPNASAMIGALGARDSMVRRYPTPSTRAALKMMTDLRDSRRAIDSGASNAQTQYEAAQKALRDAFGQTFRASMARVVDSPAPFRERLAWFWADHFTATAKTGVLRGAAGAYLDEAIRPHLGGRFADMLKAVVTHPFMLANLDQIASVGPNSRFGKRRGKGLNENLAREVLELHTLGVGGAYTQKDVRQLAELMTGLSVEPDKGFVYRAPAAEPGAETVLGKSYGGARGRLARATERHHAGDGGYRRASRHRAPSRAKDRGAFCVRDPRPVAGGGARGGVSPGRRGAFAGIPGAAGSSGGPVRAVGESQNAV